MKEKELRERTECCVCGKPFGHTGLPTFWTIKIERHVIDINAVKRQDGLAQMLGSSLLAQSIGPDEEMTKVVEGPLMGTICETCACEQMVLAEVALNISESETEEKG